MTASAIASTRTQRRKAHTRERLLEAAAEVIAERGFHEAKVQHIASRADVGTGTFYNYFPSKDEIFEALVTDTIAGLAAYLDARRDDELVMRDRLWAGWRAVLEYAEAHRARLKVLFGEGTSFHAFVQGAYDTFAEQVRSDFHAAIESGHYRVCNTGLLSAAVVGMASQVVSWWLDHPEVPLEDAAHEIAMFEWQGLRSSEAASGMVAG